MNKGKKITISTISLLVILGTSVFATKGTVNAQRGLVLRKEADKNATPITTVDNKESVEILEDNGEWYKVKYGNYEGYMFAEFVEKEETQDVQTNTETQNTEEESEQETPQETPQEEETQTVSEYPKTVEIENVKVYLIPSVTSKVIRTIEQKIQITVNYEVNQWVNITVEGKEGWIRKYFINPNAQEQTQEEENKQEENNTQETETNQDTKTPEARTIEPRKAYVNVSSAANVREKASTDSKVLNTLLNGAEVTLIGEEGDFYKIQYREEITGYIAKSLISETAPETTSRSSKGRETVKTEETAVANETGTQEASSEGQRIANFAKQYIGYDYVSGGTSPSTGFDCTGFAYYVYNSCGYNLSRSCSVQAQSGTRVEKKNLQPGDLLLFNNGANGTIGHVGIYAGDGIVVHAKNHNSGVTTDNIYNGYYEKYYYEGRRIVN